MTVLLMALAADGAAAELCYPPLQPAPVRPAGEGQNIILNADLVESKENEWMRLEGKVEMHQAERRILADHLSYTQQQGGGSAEGNVLIEQPDLKVSGAVAVFDVKRDQAQISNASYQLFGRAGHGEAKVIEVDGRDKLELRNARYTTCELGKESWWMSARRIVLDKANNNGDAYGMTVRFKQVPIMYLPYVNFALGERKSGMLAPSYGNSDRRGKELMLPIYWNIAPNRDATITPHYMSKRGWQLQSEYRYLLANGQGKLNLDYLDDDAMTGEMRALAAIKHEGGVGKRWWGKLDAVSVSDPEYLRDMGGGALMSGSTSVLNRYLTLSRYGRNFGVKLTMQDFQPLMYSLGSAPNLYRREPQLLLSGEKALSERMNFALGTELVNFARNDGLTATRMDLNPALNYRVDAGWGYAEPRLAWRYTQYWLNGQAYDGKENALRSLPIVSLDSGIVAERSYLGSGLIHTIEPRFYYLYVPYRDQSGLVMDRAGRDILFDTAQAELNYEQQFNTNRFVGADRQGDANQFNWGVQSRLINSGNGQELITGALGQTVFLADTQVTLPGHAPITAGRSDIYGALGSSYRGWRVDATGQWREAEQKPTAAHLRVGYGEGTRMLRATMSYRDQLVKQGEVIGRWPLTERWRVMGHVIHSFLQNRTLQAAAGVEYDSCCWAFRFAGRRYVNGISGQESRMIGFELELKGLANVGSNMASFSTFN